MPPKPQYIIVKFEDDPWEARNIQVNSYFIIFVLSLTNPKSKY